MSDDWAFGPLAFDRVEARDVGRAFGRSHALFGCSFSLDSGDAMVVVGPNGAGKTTLVQLLTTLDRPSEGTIQFGRFDSVTHRRGLRPHIGLVAHDSLLYPELTGLENLVFCAEMHGVNTQSAALWVERVGLRDAADRPVGTYSRGMRQRLSIARALISGPSLVLFDEPLTGLDRQARAFFFDVVRRLRAAGRIVVCVTHHLDWPPDALSTLLVLDGGFTRHLGAPSPDVAAVYARAVGA